MDVTIRVAGNGFIITLWADSATRPSIVFQGNNEETVDEMLAEVKTHLLKPISKQQTAREIAFNVSRKSE